MSALNMWLVACGWSRQKVFVGVFVLATLSFGVHTATSQAGGGPAWGVQASGPSVLVPSDPTHSRGAAFEGVVTNVGSGPAGEVVLRDVLPSGVSVVDMADLPEGVRKQGHMAPIELYWCGFGVPGNLCGNETEGHNIGPEACSTFSGASNEEVVCRLSKSVLESLAKRFTVTGMAEPGHQIEPGQYLTLIVNVTNAVELGESKVVNKVFAGDGGALETESSSESSVSAHPSFGITKLSVGTSESVPSVIDRDHWSFVNRPVGFSQAGGHPSAMTTTVEFATEDYLTEGGYIPTPVGSPKDFSAVLPPGLLGDPLATPRCPLKRAFSPTGETLTCPADTQVGTVASYLFNGEAFLGPIYNVTPEKGQSAEFLLVNNSGANFVLTGHVGRVLNPVTKRLEYSIEVNSNGIPNLQVYKVETTFWGVPASETHRSERGLTCERTRIYSGWTCGKFGHAPGNQTSGGAEVPFLTWQSDCSAGGETLTAQADSWENPVRYEDLRQVAGEYALAKAQVSGATGCNLLQFDPSIKVQADNPLADAPVGLNVGLEVPQFEEPRRLATPELSKSVISLPAGVSVSPAAVNGLQACEAMGPTGINMGTFENDPESEEVGQNGGLQLAPGRCPGASIIGTAEAESPLLDAPVKGHVYLARPECGNAALGQTPCTEQDALDGKLYRLYLELGGTGPLADAGVNIKVLLRTQANPATGQLTSVTEEIAQLPFSKLVVHLDGGAQAPLANPPTCGSAVTTADFSTWAAPGTTPEGVFMPGLGDATSSSRYEVEGCADPPGLAPGFVAGTVTPNAGRFTSFTVNISRKDREQYIKGVQVHTPPGLLGVLASVPLCGEADADAGTCPEASKIGTTRVASGAGSSPFEIEGNMYLTSPHDGAPFGLSIVTDAVAGPFNLGKVIVRARINVDPHDSSLTVTTDEAGPYAVPQIIFGVPLRLQRITANVTRPGFMFNPTNCKAQEITAKISGNQQAVASVSSPFAAGGCRSLAFKPVFKVFTNGHTSRKLGASLDTRLSYPKNALGNDANIAYVKVSLPKQLPSYLPTLQKACPVRTFDANPSQCPPGSIVGAAQADSPLLPALPKGSGIRCVGRKGCTQRTSVAGPVYFVSHGGEQFPQLIIVLQGDGVRVDLVGDTFISKGITSSTFKTVPDVPVNSFELFLPQSKNYALAANGNLCKEMSKLIMPTTFIAQNGAKIRQSTRISVTGCSNAGSAGRPQHSSKRGRNG